MKTIRTNILCLILISFCGSALSEEPPPPTQVFQEISTLSSSQFYTNFTLIRTMLKGDWDQKVFEQFSYYDGVSLQLTKRYGEKLKDDKKWGPFFEMKNSLHMETYKQLKPLIEKKGKGEQLGKADRKLLEDLDQRIPEKLMK